MKKKINKKAIIIVVFLILIISTVVFFILENIDYNKNIKIIATKVIPDNEQRENETLIIKIKEYNIESIQKIIKYETKEMAKSEYKYKQMINESEQKEIQLEQKGKKIIITISEEQFKFDINYRNDKNISLILEDEQKEILNKQYLKELLIEQGYKIEN